MWPGKGTDRQGLHFTVPGLAAQLDIFPTQSIAAAPIGRAERSPPKARLHSSTLSGPLSEVLLRRPCDLRGCFSVLLALAPKQ